MRPDELPKDKADQSGAIIGAAVRRSRLLSAEGLRERLFTLAFSNLVYPQIWEDPAVDLEALELDAAQPHHHHRLGRLQCAELPDRRPGAHHGSRSQRRPYRAQPAQAGGGAPSAGSRTPSTASSALADAKANIAALRAAHPARISTRRRARYWDGRHGVCAGGGASALRAQFLPRRPARPFHRRSHLVARLHGAIRARCWRPASLDEQRRIFDARTRAAVQPAHGALAGRTGPPRSMAWAFRRRNTRRWPAT